MPGFSFPFIRGIVQRRSQRATMSKRNGPLRHERFLMEQQDPRIEFQGDDFSLDGQAMPEGSQAQPVLCAGMKLAAAVMSPRRAEEAEGPPGSPARLV